MSDSKEYTPKEVAGANRVGYGPDGIEAGTAAARQMSEEATKSGGGVQSGGTVAELQSAGSKGNYYASSGGDQQSSQVTAGANRLGSGPDGIQAGTAAATLMSEEAKRSGGGVHSAGTVPELQSAGSK